MSYRVKMLLPLVGLLLLCGYAAFAVIRSGNKVTKTKQPMPSSVGNLAEAKLPEIKDAAGQIVLSGNIVHRNKHSNDLEGEALLTSTGIIDGAKGEFEFEVSTNRNNVTEKELEVSVRKLTPNSAFSLYLDGKLAATFNTDQHGAAELEMSDAPTK